MKDFRGKVAVVTGAGSGIGRALAMALADAGASVVLADIDPVGLKESGAVLAPSAEGHLEHALDVSDMHAVHALALLCMERYGRVDLVFNNAGIGIGMMPFHTTDLDLFERVMRVNFYGTLHGSRAFAPYLLERPEAALVNISSVFGLTGIDSNAAYCASKFAVHGLNQALYQEYRNTALVVHSVHPGGVNTNITRNSLAPTGYEEAFHSRFLKIPPQRAASIILKGVRRKQHRILIGKEAHTLDLAVRLMPVLGGTLVNMIIRKKVSAAMDKATNP